MTSAARRIRHGRQYPQCCVLRPCHRPLVGAAQDRDEGVRRLKALGFSPVSRLETGDPGQKIAAVAEEIGASLVVVGHHPQGRLARWWFGTVGSYLVKRLRCSVLVAQTEIGDEEFKRLTSE